MSSAVTFEGVSTSGAATLLAGQNHILEMIATRASLADILAILARLIESQVQGLLCSVLLIDEEGRLRHGAAPSIPEAYNKAIDGAMIGPNVGSCGTAAYRRKPVVVTDILEDPLWLDYRDLAIRHGLRACWSTPFFSREGEVLGTFAMYYATPRSPRAMEQQLIGVATRIATIAVERSRTDAELRRVAAIYRARVENLNDVVFSLTLNGDISYVSPAIEHVSGYDAAEVIGLPFGKFIHPEDLRIVQESFTNTLAGKVAPCEFRVIDKLEAVHWCRSSSRVQMADGRMVGVNGVIVDITEHKQTQEALRAAEQKYRAIVEDAIVGIFRTTPDGRYLSANPELARMLGYDSSEQLLRTISDVANHVYVDPQRRAEFKTLMEKQGSVRSFECEVYRKNRSKMWVSVSARAVYESGRIVAYEGMNEDITERKLLEQQLLQAQKMEAVGQLAGGIAHDFNNLLGVILGNGELLLQRLLATDPLRRRIEQMCQAGERAVSLTAQLLAFSRKQVMQPTVLDFNTVISNLNEMIPRLIGEGITVVTRLDPALGRTKADVGQIEQVLLNLAVNARDAMAQGGTLTIATSNVEIDRISRLHTGVKEGRYVLLEVSDTGIGMDQATLAHIFEPFFTTKEPGKGTGLGLATAYGVVKQSGGYISVGSEPGQGTTFSIYLPRTEDEVVTAKSQERSNAPILKGKETILLVEDAAPMREITREFLVGSGYEVLEAQDAKVALEMAERHQSAISLVITDVVMPGMNGYALAERLKTLRPETKVLYVSGYADDAIFQQGVVPSGIDFLHKPYTQADLSSKLRQVLDAAS